MAGGCCRNTNGFSTSTKTSAIATNQSKAKQQEQRTIAEQRTNKENKETLGALKLGRIECKEAWFRSRRKMEEWLEIPTQRNSR